MTGEPLAIGKLPGPLLARLLAGHRITDSAVIVGPGIGRDAAVIDPGDGYLVCKTDPITFATSGAPHYLVNVNANDLACMGATPRWLLVTALLPAGQTGLEDVERTFAELQDACDRQGIALVGGHTEISDGVTRTILIGQMLGTVVPEKLIAPGAAQPRDRLLLTRPIAIEGTALLASELGDLLTAKIGAEMTTRAARLLESPGIAVSRDAAVIVAAGGVRALHDPTEGGLAMGLREMAVAAGCGVIVSREAIPVHLETQAVADALGLDPLGMLGSGSLLAAIDPAHMAEVEAACQAAGVPAVWIGKLTPIEQGLRMRSADGEHELPTFDTDEVARALAASAHRNEER